MKPTTVFSSKAEIYAKYRWKYAPESINTISKVTGISKESLAADIGAGTGILTREFVGKVRRVYAVEPNPEMRAILARELEHSSACEVVEGRAEETTLAGHSIDLVTVAQAIQWFDPIAVRKEFHRILKPGGWLAICRNDGTDQELGKALSEVYPVEISTEELMIGRNTPRSFYFCGEDYIKQEFPFRLQVGWEGFLGALSSASYAPDKGSTFYVDFERGARKVFERFSSNNVLEQHGVTELYLGQINC